MFLIPVRIFNSESEGLMGLKVWDWGTYIIKAADKISVAFSLIRLSAYRTKIEAAGNVQESSSDEYPYANEQGILVV